MRCPKSHAARTHARVPAPPTHARTHAHFTIRANRPNPTAAATTTTTTTTIRYNRNVIFNKGLNPHFYCLPILKREEHRRALVAAVTSGDAKFFIGSDSAPHPVGAKESACGCAGCFTAHATVALYAEAFDAVSVSEGVERRR